MEEFKEIVKLELITNPYVRVCDILYILVALTHCLFCSSFVFIACCRRTRSRPFACIYIDRWAITQDVYIHFCIMYLIMYILIANDVEFVKYKYIHTYYIYIWFMYAYLALKLLFMLMEMWWILHDCG